MSRLLKHIEAILEHADLPVHVQITKDDLEWLRAAERVMGRRFVLQVEDRDLESEKLWADHSWFPTGFEAETAMISYGTDHPTMRLRVWDSIDERVIVRKDPEPPPNRFAKLWDLYNLSWIDMAEYQYLRTTDAWPTIAPMANKLKLHDFRKWLTDYIRTRRAIVEKVETESVFSPGARDLIDKGQISFTNAMELAKIPADQQSSEVVGLAGTMSAKSFKTFMKGFLAT